MKSLIRGCTNFFFFLILKVTYMSTIHMFVIICKPSINIKSQQVATKRLRTTKHQFVTEAIDIVTP